MILQRIVSEGLAHYSYLVGDGGNLAVIDPRRDVGVYLELARQAGGKITAILETHRHEDMILGSQELRQLTGADIYISGHEDVGHVYGNRIRDGFSLQLGGIALKAIHTPGHTLGHLSYALYEDGRETPYLVFTGDSLFIGDLARTDLYGPEQLESMTNRMYETVFERLLPLGDEVLIMPAHGAGSACGQSMEERPYSTLGYERRYNAQLQDESRSAFIQRFGRMRLRPAYFDRMRRYNVTGAQPLGLGMVILPVTLKEAADQELVLVDCRPKEAFNGGHIPGSIYLNMDNWSVHLGTILDPDTPLALIIDPTQLSRLEEIFRQSRRIGFEQIRGFIPQAIVEWQTSGCRLERLDTISSEEFMNSPAKDSVLLDLRKEHEYNAGDPPNRLLIPLEELRDRLAEIPKDKLVYLLCASGNRAITAASMLQRAGVATSVITGGIKGLRQVGKQ